MLKKAIATTICVATTALMLATPTSANGNAVTTTYTEMGIVTEVDYETDTVWLNTFDEKLRSFKECDDWFVGDFAVMTMSDNGTPYDYSDDTMLDVVYSGSMHWINTSENGFSLRSFSGENYTDKHYEYEKSEPKQYPETGIVTNVDYIVDAVEVTTFDGHHFEFYGAEDWWNGDIVALTMNDNGTDHVTDDEIIDTKYGGHVTYINSKEDGFYLTTFGADGWDNYWYEWE